MKGIVKWFNNSKGYGFITGDDGNEYFFHHSEITGELLKDDDPVTFEPTKTDRGWQAKDVKKDEGAEPEKDEGAEPEKDEGAEPEKDESTDDTSESDESKPEDEAEPADETEPASDDSEPSKE